MTAEPAHHWREIAFNAAIVATGVVARTDFAAVFVPIAVGLLLIAGCYAIASGSQSSVPIRNDEVWAKELLARPQWIDTMLLTARWATIGFLTFWFMHWDTPLQPLLEESALLIPAALPIVIAAAFAMTWWERRDARRALKRSTFAKADRLDVAYQRLAQETLSDWNSKEDDEAFRHL